MIVTTALANTMLQTLVPDALRGRVMAFYAFVFVGMAPLGAFQAGLIAEHTSAPFAIAVGGAGCLIAILLAAWRAPAPGENWVRATPPPPPPPSSRRPPPPGPTSPPSPPRATSPP